MTWLNGDSGTWGSVLECFEQVTHFWVTPGWLTLAQDGGGPILYFTWVWII